MFFKKLIGTAVIAAITASISISAFAATVSAPYGIWSTECYDSDTKTANLTTSDKKGLESVCTLTDSISSDWVVTFDLLLKGHQNSASYISFEDESGNDVIKIERLGWSSVAYKLNDSELLNPGDANSHSFTITFNFDETDGNTYTVKSEAGISVQNKFTAESINNIKLYAGKSASNNQAQLKNVTITPTSSEPSETPEPEITKAEVSEVTGTKTFYYYDETSGEVKSTSKQNRIPDGTQVVSKGYYFTVTPNDETVTKVTVTDSSGKCEAQSYNCNLNGSGAVEFGILSHTTTGAELPASANWKVDIEKGGN